VRVISKKTLRAFWEDHADSQDALLHWYKAATKAVWDDLDQVRRTYPHADVVKLSEADTVTVFNIKGNSYRLIARINYEFKLINIRAVMTHAQYSKGAWKK